VLMWLLLLGSSVVGLSLQLPILKAKRSSLRLKGVVHNRCVKSCMLHGTETWPERSKSVSIIKSRAKIEW